MNKLILITLAIILIGCPSDDTQMTITKNHVPNYNQSEPSPVPEPASMALLGLGMVGVAYWRRRK